MAPENIDYDNLKKRGFLKQRQEGFVILRTRMPAAGTYSDAELKLLADLSKKYAHGIIHATVRQGLEIPFIKLEDIPEVERELTLAGITVGTSGARLRATTVCPGNNWCKQGLVDTFSLAESIEKELGLKCGLDLPHKFKIAISGCPNSCTRPQYLEIGIHGSVDSASTDKRIGYVVYLGGCAGKTPRTGFPLGKIYSKDEVLLLIERVVVFFKRHAKPRQRLALLIEEFGRDNFLKEISL